MYNSKLIAYLKVLTAEELKQLSRFMQSPYFFEKPPAPVLQHLLTFLRPFHPDFPKEKVNKAAAFTYCFPGQAFDQKKIEFKMYDLFKVIEQFIVQHFTSTQTIDHQLVQLRFLRERGLAHHFDLTIKRIRRAQQKRTERGAVFYRQQFELAREVMLKESRRRLRGSDLNLPQVHQSLDIDYLVNKLEYACHLLAQSKHHLPLEAAPHLTFLQYLQPALAAGHYADIPQVQLYFAALQWLQEEKEPSASFTKELKKYRHALPADQLKSIHTLYRNYCVRKYNEGEEKYLHYLYDIYCMSLEEGLLFNNGGLLQSTMQNMVSIGLKLRKYDWVHQFLQQYRDQIVDTTAPEEVYSFNLARYHFALRQFEEALDCMPTEYEDLYYKIEARLLEVKIYYEQDSELLDHKMQACKVYLHRISNALLPKVQQEGFNNFIDFLKQICHPRTFKNEKRIEKLQAKLAATKVITDREWLAEKLATLK
ncbi:MAG: hypothetical protein AAGG75_19420 [Bacteroidota bacterium]